MLYCNKRIESNRRADSDVHHHRHDPGAPHPPASVPPSILRLSVTERLAVAAHSERAAVGRGLLGDIVSGR